VSTQRLAAQLLEAQPWPPGFRAYLESKANPKPKIFRERGQWYVRFHSPLRASGFAELGFQSWAECLQAVYWHYRNELIGMRE
jgi:hypothetical protein